jgi:hypothetical protein
MAMKEQEEEWQLLCQQASVEQDRDKLLQLIKRITALLDAKEKRLQQNSALPARRSNHVFQIAYDSTLLVAREHLLKSRGYDVSSVLGNEDAQQSLANGQRWRLFIVGHNAPRETREEMVRWLKKNFPHTTVLALNPPSQDKLTEADFNFVLNGPEEWLAAVSRTAG